MKEYTIGRQYAETAFDGGLVFVEDTGRFFCRRFFTNERRAVIARDIQKKAK
jgi:hypothetical protein